MDAGRGAPGDRRRYRRRVDLFRERDDRRTLRLDDDEGDAECSDAERPERREPWDRVAPRIQQLLDPHRDLLRGLQSTGGKELLRRETRRFDEPPKAGRVAMCVTGLGDHPVVARDLTLE